MILELFFLILFLLVEPPNTIGDCDCHCSCGRKHHLPSTYHGTSSTEEIKLNDEAVTQKHNQNEDGPIYVGGDGDWNEESPSNPIESYTSKTHYDDNGSKKDYSGRPTPPHLVDRAVSGPDWQLAHGNKKIKNDFWCGPCHKRFVDLLALQQHTFAVHTTGAKSGMSSSTQEHRAPSNISVSPETDKPVPICEVCSEEVPNAYSLRTHKTLNHPWSVFCADCLLTFNHAQDAADHYQLIHGAESKKFGRIQSMLDTIKGPIKSTLPTSHEQLSSSSLSSSSISYTSDSSRSASNLFSRQSEIHLQKTFPSHTVGTYYECEECHMVFTDKIEFEAHNSIPLVHGGRIYQSEDFPPLGVSTSPLISSSSADSSTANSSSEEVTAWGMPSYTMNETDFPQLNDGEGCRPQARLSPEPQADSSASEEGLMMTDVKIGKVRIVKEKRGVHQEIENMIGSNSLVESDELEEHLIIDDDDEETYDRKDSNDTTMSDSTFETITSAQQAKTPNECIIMKTQVDNTDEVKGTEEAIESSSILSGTDINTDRTIPSLQTISPKPIIQSIPSHVKLTPYARAALASRSQIEIYPPPNDLYDESKAEVERQNNEKEEIQPTVIGGIECQIPSFFFHPSPSKKKGVVNTHTSTPLTLKSDNVKGKEEEDQWLASQEVYEITVSQRRQTFSLDLGAPSNGNRPIPKYKQQQQQQRQQASENGKKNKSKRKPKEKETYLSPSQRDAYGSKDRKQDKQSPQPALQPLFESEWSTLSTSSHYPTGGRGGRIVKEHPWDRSSMEAEERNRLVQAGTESTEDLYGGW
ncbi:uncharacterized protein IL334_000582 [Kwoniella shivajii]|uniref:C2H2-type domain-containing protein n=1 Tax=Kwoniella shivajii TaxID=564305 RepID=A0ABZ1CQJ2_9TREE|nr:hypothetical protein IL334_000582 [Kwoniella shivajii]